MDDDDDALGDANKETPADANADLCLRRHVSLTLCVCVRHLSQWMLLLCVGLTNVIITIGRAFIKLFI